MSRFALKFCLALTLALSAVACGPEQAPPVKVVQRLASESPGSQDPADLLRKAEIFEAQVVASWALQTEDDLGTWTLHEVAGEPTPNGIYLTSSGDEPHLVRDVELEADAIHAIEVVMPGPRQGDAELYWAAAGDDFSDERKIILPRDAMPRNGGGYLIDVGSHPEWKGAIGHLRLDPTQAANKSVMLASVNAIRWVPLAEGLAGALARPWKIDLGSDLRNALLAPPGLAITRPLSVDDQQQLSFAFGLEEGVRDDVTFVVEANSVNATEKSELFRRTMKPKDAGRWLTATLDLQNFAGQEIELHLETRSVEGFDLGRGFPVWGNPEILGPSTTDPLPNVLVISLDTLRADHLSAYGYARETSPNIDAWARESGVLFQNTVVQASWTLPSHVSIFTGLETMRHGVNHFGSTPASFETMAELLNGAGYTTGAVTGGGYLRPQFGFAQGFDSFRYWPQILAKQELEEGMDHALDWLTENHNRRFFFFFHTYEIHFPHRRREPYFTQLASAGEIAMALTRVKMRPREADPSNITRPADELVVKRPGSGEWENDLTEAEKALVVSMYDSAIAYTDQYMARLFEHLEALGVLENTIIILTSDHGEALGEEDIAGHNYLEEHNVLVPLIISFPDGTGAGEVIEKQVRSVDILPTLADYLGVKPSKAMDGVSLLPLVRDGEGGPPPEAWTYAPSANYGLALRYQNRWKYHFNNTAWSSILGEEKLYNLTRDPEERKNLATAMDAGKDLAAMHQRTRDFVDEVHEGLRLEIVNNRRQNFAGMLTGAWADHSRVKATDASCGCVHWEPGRLAEFSLARGQRITLYFENLAGAELGIFGGLGSVTFEEVFNVPEEERLFLFANGQWNWQEVAEEGSAVITDRQTGFRLWKTGQRDAEAALPEQDPETIQQLRALGYVQ